MSKQTDLSRGAYSQVHGDDPATYRERQRRDAVYLTGPQLCRRFNVCSMTIHRWRQNPKLRFPTPTKINNRNYFLLAEIEEFELRLRYQGEAA